MDELDKLQELNENGWSPEVKSVFDTCPARWGLGLGHFKGLVYGDQGENEVDR